AELEGQMGDQSVGLQARMMSQAMRKLTGTLNRTQTMCVFTNQIREKVGVMFGPTETQPGGRALKFYSSVRLDIRRIETLKDGTEAVGNRVKVKVVKNKVAAPFKQAEFDIEFGKGISTSGCLIDYGIEHNIITKSGSFFSYGEERLGQGRGNAKAFLDEHQDMAKEIEGKIYEVLGIGRDLVKPIEGREDAPEAPLAAVESVESQAARGTDRELIEATLADADASFDAGAGAGGVGPASAPDTDLDRALGVLRARFSAPPRERRERERALGVLLRKGYEYELALDALSR